MCRRRVNLKRRESVIISMKMMRLRSYHSQMEMKKNGCIKHLEVAIKTKIRKLLKIKIHNNQIILIPN